MARNTVAQEIAVPQQRRSLWVCIGPNGEEIQIEAETFGDACEALTMRLDWSVMLEADTHWQV